MVIIYSQDSHGPVQGVANDNAPSSFALGNHEDMVERRQVERHILTQPTRVRDCTKGPLSEAR